MKLTARILILTLTLALAIGATAQETTTATTTSATTTTGTTTGTTTVAGTTPSEEPEATDTDATRRHEVRASFNRLLSDHPRALPMLLKLDPGLSSNAQFLSKYPELQAFLDQHPEVRRNPEFYLADFSTPGRETPVESVVEMLAVLGGFSLGLFAITWLIRTIVEQRRWNRLSRTQSEVHNKILDRFGSSEEVLAYIQSPAGTKFLESAPIPVQPARPAHSAPFGRVIGSIQAGVVIAIAALGMLLVSLRFEGESENGLFAMGVIAFSIGVGFIASAMVSVAMSRRLGLLEGRGENEELKEPGLVR